MLSVNVDELIKIAYGTVDYWKREWETTCAPLKGDKRWKANAETS